jgi:hypothetical protein
VKGERKDDIFHVKRSLIDVEKTVLCAVIRFWVALLLYFGNLLLVFKQVAGKLKVTARHEFFIFQSISMRIKENF